MWSQLKKIPLSLKSRRMDNTELELALEAIKDPGNMDHHEEEQVVPDDDEEDESSIEALNWSDFDDEEVEAAKQFAAREFPTNSSPVQEPVVDMKISQESEEGTLEENDNDESESKESDEDAQTTSVISVSTSQMMEEDLDFPDEIMVLETDPATAFENIIEDMDIEEFITTAVGSEPLSSNDTAACKEDVASNAPVLDDGPIWGKGEKSYKFHENRKINQKLTFGVLISVVLAIGIGVGNLVAYNEYESETVKVDQMHCHAPIHPHEEKPADLPLPTGFPSSTHIKGKAGQIHGANLDTQATSNSKETLAYVVKSIDELSRKLDQFQNTTKQLSGIIVMRDDAFPHEHGRKVREALDSAEDKGIIDEDLMPMFNDDVSSWEDETTTTTSGERLVKFSDVVYDQQTQPAAEPTSHKILGDMPNRNSFQERNNDEMPTPTKSHDPVSESKEFIRSAIDEKQNEPCQRRTKKRESTVEREERPDKQRKSKKDKTHNKPKDQKSKDYIQKEGAKKHFKTDKSPEREQRPSETNRYKREKSVENERLAKLKKLKRQEAVYWDDINREAVYWDEVPDVKADEEVVTVEFKKKKSEGNNIHDRKYKREKSIDKVNMASENFQKENSPAREQASRDKKREKSPEREYKREKSPDRDIPDPRHHRVNSDKDFQSEKDKKKSCGDTKKKQKCNGKRYSNDMNDAPQNKKQFKKEKSVERDQFRNGEKLSDSRQEFEDFNNYSVGPKQYKEGKPSKTSFTIVSNNNANNNNEIRQKNRETRNHHQYKSHKTHSSGEFKENNWDEFRAKVREQQRVHQNWNNDFHGERKRHNKNWQIERDNMREKFRKNHPI